jgi:hypothetical protein
MSCGPTPLDPSGDLALCGPPHRACGRSRTFGCDAARRPRPERAMSNHWCPPRGRDTRRYARVTRSIPRYVRGRVSGTQHTRCQCETSREQAHRGCPRTGNSH